MEIEQVSEKLARLLEQHVQDSLRQLFPEESRSSQDGMAKQASPLAEEPQRKVSAKRKLNRLFSAQKQPKLDESFESIQEELEKAKETLLSLGVDLSSHSVHLERLILFSCFLILTLFSTRPNKQNKTNKQTKINNNRRRNW